MAVDIRDLERQSEAYRSYLRGKISEMRLRLYSFRDDRSYVICLEDEIREKEAELERLDRAAVPRSIELW